MTNVINFKKYYDKKQETAQLATWDSLKAEDGYYYDIPDEELSIEDYSDDAFMIAQEVMQDVVDFYGARDIENMSHKEQEDVATSIIALQEVILCMIMKHNGVPTNRSVQSFIESLSMHSFNKVSSFLSEEVE